MHEYVTRYDYTFNPCTGSRWSGIGQIITENFNYTKDELIGVFIDTEIFQDTQVHWSVWNLVMTFID